MILNRAAGCVWDRLSSLSLDRLESRSHKLKPAAQMVAKLLSADRQV